MICSYCGTELGDDFIRPECHQDNLCKDCWKNHKCDILTDSTGRIVNVGDRMRHVDDKRIYVITEIVPTYTKGQVCVGEKELKSGKLDGKRYTLRTRLMEVIVGYETRDSGR